MKKQLSKAKLKELKADHKFRCKCKYYGMLSAYFIDFSVKSYLLYMVGGVYVAYGGALVDLLAKIVHIRNTKCRGKGEL